MSAAGVDARSALARLEAPLRLVDDVDAALAAHEAVVAMPAAQRFQRITDFHGTSSKAPRGGLKGLGGFLRAPRPPVNASRGTCRPVGESGLLRTGRIRALRCFAASQVRRCCPAEWRFPACRCRFRKRWCSDCCSAPSGSGPGRAELKMIAATIRIAAPMPIGNETAHAAPLHRPPLVEAPKSLTQKSVAHALVV